MAKDLIEILDPETSMFTYPDPGVLVGSGSETRIEIRISVIYTLNHIAAVIYCNNSSTTLFMI